MKITLDIPIEEFDYDEDGFGNHADELLNKMLDSCNGKRRGSDK